MAKEYKESLIECIKKALVNPKVGVRVVALFLLGISFLLITAITSYLILPEGILKNAHPLMNWDVSHNLIIGSFQIFGYNLIFAVIMMSANLFAKSSKKSVYYLPTGYLSLYILFCIYGIYVGTWSFQMATTSIPFIDRLLGMFNITQASGLIEMFSFCCLAGATANISIVKTKSRNTTATKLRDIRLSRVETISLVIGLCLLFLAAFIETNSIHQAYEQIA